MIRARPVPPVAPKMAMCCGEEEKDVEMLRRDNMAVVNMLLFGCSCVGYKAV